MLKLRRYAETKWTGNEPSTACYRLSTCPFFVQIHAKSQITQREADLATMQFVNPLLTRIYKLHLKSDLDPIEAIKKTAHAARQTLPSYQGHVLMIKYLLLTAWNVGTSHECGAMWRLWQNRGFMKEWRSYSTRVGRGLGRGDREWRV